MRRERDPNVPEAPGSTTYARSRRRTARSRRRNSGSDRFMRKTIRRSTWCRIDCTRSTSDTRPHFPPCLLPSEGSLRPRPLARRRSYTQLVKIARARMVRGRKGASLMRDFVLIVGLILPVTAQAQVLVPAPPPVNQDGMKDFCIYGNENIRSGRTVRRQLEFRAALRGERGVEIRRTRVLELRQRGVAGRAGLALRDWG